MTDIKNGTPSEEGAKKDLSVSQKLALEIYHVCVGHTVKDIREAIDMFQWKMDDKATLNPLQKTFLEPRPK